MEQNQFVVNYSVRKNCFSGVRSAVPDIFFDSPCIGYVKKGYAKFLYHGKTMYAREGDLIYIAHGTHYQSIWFGAPEIEWYSIHFSFTSKYALYEYRFQILQNFPGELFEKIYETYETKPFRSLAYFYELLHLLFQRLVVDKKPAVYQAVAPAIEHIEKHYREEFSIKHLVSLCHCSESGFFKQFKAATGVTPISYKQNLMIQHALELLEQPELSIEEISRQAGFSSSNYFRTVFQKRTGKLPKELKKKK